ncbi:MAG TPA: anaerobic carbon-monoxide dehydrogenase catalytic subunit [Syntrophaceticus sp.]|nr:anaerobic carbon-monoxide dehydrogenase catalytic subunit [Syntrophaceticus sp.]
MRLCLSADKTINQFLGDHPDVETSFSREPKQSVKCGFGLQGVCCRLCSNGPCRVLPDSPRGVCGADSDTIVARYFLRSVAAGAACYLHVVENAARTLAKLAEETDTSFNNEVLQEMVEICGIEADDYREQAAALADYILQDLYLPRSKKMTLVNKLAYKPRLAVWEKLNLMPGGAKSEVFDALVKTSTNLSSDPLDMLLHALRLGIATGLYGLYLTNKLNDIILGEPEIGTTKVGFSVIDPDYINIMVTGHQHALFKGIQEELTAEWAKELAEQVGAKGFKIVGCTCVGQDMESRHAHCKQVFAGHAGNNFTSEVLLSTGAVDLVVSEFNCTIPGIEEVCNKLLVKQVCIDDVAKKKNAQLIPYTYDNGRAIARQIAEEAAGSFKERRKGVNIDLPEHGYDNSLTGFSEKNLRSFLGGNYEPLLKLITEGKIKGVAAIVGCSNLTAGGHDVFTTGLTKELIKNDILVLSAGCTSSGLANTGFMTPEAAELAGDNLRQVCQSLNIPPVLNFGPCLGIGRLEEVAVALASALSVDLPQLPLVLSAPQWLEEQALADGSFALALGLPLHLAQPPFITGSKMVTKVLTEDLETLTGGRVIVDGNVETAAAKLIEIISQKRTALKI